MNIRRTLPLALIALSAAVLAVPACASAVTIKDAGKPVDDKEFVLSGKTSFNALGSGVECEVNTKITVKGDVVDVTEYNVVIATCVGFGVPFKNCKMKAATSKGTPWAINLFTNSLRLFEGEVIGEAEDAGGKTCFTKTLDVTFIGVIATVNNVTAIKSATLSGEVTIDTDASKTMAIAEGTLNVVGADSATYEIS